MAGPSPSPHLDADVDVVILAQDRVPEHLRVLTMSGDGRGTIRRSGRGALPGTTKARWADGARPLTQKAMTDEKQRGRQAGRGGASERRLGRVRLGGSLALPPAVPKSLLYKELIK